MTLGEHRRARGRSRATDLVPLSYTPASLTERILPVMDIDRLPSSVATLYAELLEQALVHERITPMEAQLPGGPVAKTIRGRRYLYWQVRKGEQVSQRYLGPDSGELREAVRRVAEGKRSADEQRAWFDRLAAMLLQGGAAREDAQIVSVLRLLADLGCFRRGGVLIGTQAFRCYGNLLAVRLPAASLRTQDIDVAQRLDVAIAASAEPPVSVEASLSALGLLAVPGLDPGSASTSFHMRKRELRVDFLTPARSRHTEEPVAIPGLGVSAWPLSGLDYLIEEPVPAVVLGATAVLVRVPRPGRFALHTLWTAPSRPVAEQAKAGKDRAQATALINVLAIDRPDDLREALDALARRPNLRRRVLAELERLPPDLTTWLP